MMPVTVSMQQLFKTLKNNYILILVISLAFLLRFYHLDFQSLWVDEINTMVQATPHQNLEDTYKSLLSNDLQPPLYFYVLKYLFRIFGYSTFILRFFSVLLGVAGVYAIFLLGREIANKKVGLFAALLLCINYYHIHYSQEGRPYAFLVLFSILSFYRLSIFVRAQNKRNAIIYGVMSALMLYGHPIALFALFAQYCILLYYFLKLKENVFRWSFFKFGLLFTLTTIVIYIPAIPLLLSASKVESFWIELPWSGIFAYILAQFFGSSELILSLVYVCLIFFFIRAFNEKEVQPYSPENSQSGYLKAYVILFPWLICCILIPLIRSYLKVPMIIPRYMNVILPTVILFLAIAVSQIGHKTIRITVLSLFVIFSFTDLIVVKDFYNKRTKTDFRGITNHVMENIRPDDQLVSRIGWHYSYFFENTTPKYPVLWNTYQAYVETMMKWPENFKHGFWFLDAQEAPLTLTPEATSYLYTHYFIDSKKDLYQAVGFHFVYKTEDYKRVNFPSYPQISDNANGMVELESDGTLKSNDIFLQKGVYNFLVTSRSLPEQKLNSINAHITIKLNNKIIGGVFLNEKETASTKKIKVIIGADGNYNFELVFDNGFALNDKVRKATIYSVHLQKIPNN